MKQGEGTQPIGSSSAVVFVPLKRSIPGTTTQLARAPEAVRRLGKLTDFLGQNPSRVSNLFVKISTIHRKGPEYGIAPVWNDI
jgi:hypothetical protein